MRFNSCTSQLPYKNVRVLNQEAFLAAAFFALAGLDLP